MSFSLPTMKIDFYNHVIGLKEYWLCWMPLLLHLDEAVIDPCIFSPYLTSTVLGYLSEE